MGAARAVRHESVDETARLVQRRVEIPANLAVAHEGVFFSYRDLPSHEERLLLEFIAAIRRHAGSRSDCTVPHTSQMILGSRDGVAANSLRNPLDTSTSLRRKPTPGSNRQC